MSLPQQRIRGKLVWVWWVPGSMRPQGTRPVGPGKLLMFICRCFAIQTAVENFSLVLGKVGMELSCKLGSPLR
eukprot:1146939-Pelagomonas_calceolata.AAC.13